jgi:adenylyltransferase/sulfurtransferase
LETTPLILKKWIDEGRGLLLLDVREPLEYQICHIRGSKLIPLGQLRDRVGELDKSKAIVAYCHVGIRSAAAVELLSGMGFKSVKNLKGGITAWADQVDPSMPKY